MPRQCPKTKSVANVHAIQFQSVKSPVVKARCLVFECLPRRYFLRFAAVGFFAIAVDAEAGCARGDAADAEAGCARGDEDAADAEAGCAGGDEVADEIAGNGMGEEGEDDAMGEGEEGEGEDRWISCN